MLKKKVGVIVARFQTPYLTEGHKHLIETVCNENEHIVFILGTVEPKLTHKNPLDFESRKEMVQTYLGDKSIDILPLKDMKSDIRWGEELDKLLDNYTESEVNIYGGRDCFKQYYSGRYNVIDVHNVFTQSGTDTREMVAQNPNYNQSFREGVIYASYTKYPTCYPTVDVAILDGRGNLLLGRKPNEELFRFIGGFADPSDEDYETSARREVEEEVNNISTERYTYICSAKINDWRYKGQTDGIKTLFFKCLYVSGDYKGTDDIEEVKWFDIKSLKNEEVVEGHRVLLDKLKENLY